MRKLLFLAFVVLAGCGQAPADGASVTVTLPPPTELAAEPPVEPGFTVSIAGPDRAT